jgi:hypothetical protein
VGESFAGLQKDQLQMNTDVLAARIARDYVSDCKPFFDHRHFRNYE